MKILLAALAVTLVPVASTAGDLNLTVRDTAGKPVRDAVISVYPAAGLPAGPIRFPWPYVMAQQNIQFDPAVLVVPVGAEVAFPNRDKVRHHVYSFSPVKKFELKLYGNDETRSVVFDKAGVDMGKLHHGGLPEAAERAQVAQAVTDLRPSKRILPWPLILKLPAQQP